MNAARLVYAFLIAMPLPLLAALLISIHRRPRAAPVAILLSAMAASAIGPFWAAAAGSSAGAFLGWSTWRTRYRLGFLAAGLATMTCHAMVGRHIIDQALDRADTAVIAYQDQATRKRPGFDIGEAELLTRYEDCIQHMPGVKRVLAVNERDICQGALANLYGSSPHNAIQLMHDFDIHGGDSGAKEAFYAVMRPYYLQSAWQARVNQETNYVPRQPVTAAGSQ